MDSNGKRLVLLRYNKNHDILFLTNLEILYRGQIQRMIALECENVRDLQSILLDFKCEGKNNRIVGSRQNNLSRSSGLSLSMVSINSSGHPDLGREWDDRDPQVWSPPVSEQ